jgi:hypothetical protein
MRNATRNRGTVSPVGSIVAEALSMRTPGPARACIYPADRGRGRIWFLSHEAVDAVRFELLCMAKELLNCGPFMLPS